MPAWQHNVKLDLVPNPDYHGNRIPQNKGLRFVFYANLDTAYADLLSSNLDVLDTIPSSLLSVYRRDLGDRYVSAPAAVNQTLDTPLRLPHFGGEEGRLRRLALSAAINRAQICRQIYAGARAPARDFTASSLPGFDPHIEATTHSTSIRTGRGGYGRRPMRSRNGLGRYAIAYNADGGHQEWVDAVANSIKNILGIDAVGAPQPTFATFRTQVTTRQHQLPLSAPAGKVTSRRCWSFWSRCSSPGPGADDVGYSNPKFDAAVAAAEAAPSLPQSFDPRQRGTTNPAAGHARRAAVVHDQRGWNITGGQPRRADLEWPARLRAHRQGVRWVQMGWYIARRIAIMVPVFLGATLLIYGMVFLLPGDPIAALGGDRPLSPAVAAQLRAQYHLNDPFLLQYLHYLGGIVTAIWAAPTPGCRSVSFWLRRFR